VDFGGTLRLPAAGGGAVGVVDLLVFLLLLVGSRRRPAPILLGIGRQRRQREQQGRNDGEGSHDRLAVENGSEYRIGITWCGATESDIMRRKTARTTRLTLLGPMKKWRNPADRRRARRRIVASIKKIATGGLA